MNDSNACSGFLYTTRTIYVCCQSKSVISHKDCMLSIETCQVLIDQSIRHSGYMHRDSRHSGIRHFGIRHSGSHPLKLCRSEVLIRLRSYIIKTVHSKFCPAALEEIGICARQFNQSDSCIGYLTRSTFFCTHHNTHKVLINKISCLQQIMR